MVLGAESTDTETTATTVCKKKKSTWKCPLAQTAVPQPLLPDEEWTHWDSSRKEGRTAANI